jgi:hypothetical protein
MTTDRFTFVAYKSDSADYCRNCLMANYAADHIVENMLTDKQLIEKWGTCLFRNKNLRINERGYDVWIFKNGIQIWANDCEMWDGEFPYCDANGQYTAEYYAKQAEVDAQAEADAKLINRLHNDAQAYAQQLQQEAAKKK